MTEIEWDQPYTEESDWDGLSDKMVEAGYLPPKKFSEKIEFLSRQHVDFKTIEGMKQLIQAVTWRAKIKQIGMLVYVIYVHKKKVPDIRRLAKEFGMTDVDYVIEEIKWYECWFKMFQVIDFRPTFSGYAEVFGVERDDGGIVQKLAFSQDQIDGLKQKPAEKQWCAFDLAAKGNRDYSAKATFKKKQDGSLELVDMEIDKSGVK